jgi:hypothetical protein
MNEEIKSQLYLLYDFLCPKLFQNPSIVIVIILSVYYTLQNLYRVKVMVFYAPEEGEEYKHVNMSCFPPEEERHINM